MKIQEKKVDPKRTFSNFFFFVAEILSSKLERDGPNIWDWQQQRRLLSPLIDTGDLLHPVPSSVTPAPLSTSSYGEKTRTNFDKTRDSLKAPSHQPKRRDEALPSPGFSPELFQFLKQYGLLTRMNDEHRRTNSETGVRIIFPSRRGKQFEKVDVVQKIADSSEEDDDNGNVQKIDRKVEKSEPGEEMITLEEFVEEDEDGNEDLMDANDEGLEEILRGNKTEAGSSDDDDSENGKQLVFIDSYHRMLPLQGGHKFLHHPKFLKNSKFRETPKPFVVVLPRLAPASKFSLRR